MLNKYSSRCHCLLSSQAERAISSAAQIIPATRNSPFRLCPRSLLSADVELRFEPNPPCEPPLWTSILRGPVYATVMD